MKVLELVFIITVLTIPFISCKEPEECEAISYNNINIQIKNNTGWDFKNMDLGEYMSDPSRFTRQCKQTGEFIQSIPKGNSTRYYETSGGFLGYSSVRINIVMPEGHVRPYSINQDRFRIEFLKHNAFEDSIENVFSGEMMYGLSLPDGDYIYEMTGFNLDSLYSMRFNIIKE